MARGARRGFPVQLRLICRRGEGRACSVDVLPSSLVARRLQHVSSARRWPSANAPCVVPIAHRQLSADEKAAAAINEESD